MTVVNPKSISGINSITTGSGSDDLLTIHTNNGTERLRIDSTGATKIVTGIVTTLTATTGIVTTLTSNTTTLNSTTTATGNINVSGANITLQDSGGSSDDRIVFGAGSDLSIYHDGSHSYIDNTGTGNLYIKDAGAIRINTDSFGVQKNDGSESIITGTADGAVQLYNDNTKRFETTSGGVEVFGELQMDDGNSHIKLIDGARIDMGTGADLRLYHDGSNSYINNNTGGLRINTGSDEVQINKSTSEYMARFITDGNVELYSNNVKRFQTRSGGSAADGIVVYGNSSNSSINLFTDTTIRGTVYANSSNAIGFLDEGGDWAIKHTNNTSTEFYVSTQLRAMIDSDGLKFNGDTATANALDDYEEGTFTPTISDGSGNNSTFGSVTAATYTKIGNTVRASFRAVNVQTSGLTGSDVFYVKGLPFTTSNKNYNSAFIRTWNASTWGAAKCINFAFVENDQVYFMSDDGTTNGGVTLKVEDMTHNSSDVFMTMVYETTQ